MSVDIRPDGSFEVTYVGPYGGLNVQMPENLIKDSESPALNDVILRNAEIRSRPQRLAGLLANPGVGTNYIGAMGVVNFKVFAITRDGVYHFNPSTQLWTLDSASFAYTAGPTTLPNYRIFQNKAYAVNSTAHLSSWDALGAFTLDNASVAGPTTVGAQFIDELDNHLIMANTNEGGTNFAQRIRWSASGLPTVWDPTVNINAGLADFLEVPDSITGLMMLGRVGYIFRTDGITEIAPTGQGVAPFDFNHLWASQVGVGNGLYYGLAQYGSTGVFISRDNIYSVQAFQLQAIGGGARDAIFKDLGASMRIAIGAGNPLPVLGSIVPTIDYDYPQSQLIINSNIAGGPLVLPYLVYYLTIPLGTGTKVWVYSFEDQSWTNFFLPLLSVTSRQSVIGTQGFVPSVGPTPVSPVVAWATSTQPGGVASIDLLDSTTFNDSAQGSSYSYRVEDVFANRVPTVRRIALTYRDLGVAAVTLTLTGTDDNQTVQTASTTVTIGNSVPTNVLMVKLVDLELTAFRPQLSWSRAANGGPVSIARATMIGQVEREVTL